MARYTGAVCRLCRRERMKLFLKGAKCDTMKCPVERKPYPPGQHGRGRIRDSEYLLQLREKQKAKRIYGMLEKQFRNVYARREPARRASPARTCCGCSSSGSTTWCSAPASPPAATRRASSSATATCSSTASASTIPSYQVRKGDVVEMSRQGAEDDRVRHNIDTLDRIVADVARGRRTDDFKAVVRDLPLREQIDVPVREQLIVELYSK